MCAFVRVVSRKIIGSSEISSFEARCKEERLETCLFIPVWNGRLMKGFHSPSRPIRGYTLICRKLIDIPSDIFFFLFNLKDTRIHRRYLTFARVILFQDFCDRAIIKRYDTIITF